jgi:hypothetical protein
MSLHYLFTFCWPILAGVAALMLYPRYFQVAAVTFAVVWVVFIATSKTQYGTGCPDVAFSQHHWVFVRMREWFSLKFHRTEKVQEALITKENPTGQAIFAFFPHGVNSDFRILMDGMMPDAFPKTYEKAPGRTLAASILFLIPGLRSMCLRTGCVDAGRKTAERCLSKGFSLMLCPGGQDEQVETIYGQERVFLKRRSGFVRLALIHGVPVVPAYDFGGSDVYYTSRAMHGLRSWLVRRLRITIPLYWGGLGMWCYPTPMGFPLPVPQQIVFGDPIVFERISDPTKEQVDAAHQRFIVSLTNLFDEHKTAYGCAGRTLEVL